MSIRMIIAALAAAVLGFAAPAFAADGWTGEGAISAAATTGNTETTDLGLSLKGARQMGDWRVKANAAADYGETNSSETRNRWGLGGQVDRDLTDRFYLFGGATYEQDQFSGYDSRFYVGPGAGYRVLTGERTKWALEAGPGYRRDEVQARVVSGVRLGSATEEGFGARAASRFSHKFNEAVGFTNDTDVIYGDLSTQIVNSAAITAKLTDALSARVSFDVRNESDPQPGREDTDTATRFSLVFGF